MSVLTSPETELNTGVSYLPADLIWRMSVAQYHAIINSGALTENDPVELLQGWIVRKMPKKPRHSTVTRIIRRLLADFVPEGWYVDSQEPITTADSEPEPDVVVIRGTELDYLARHPQPQDVGLVVEVGDTTLAQDRTLKKRLYAAAAIPVYWLINLPDNQVEVYSQPFVGVLGADYGQRQTFGLNDQLPVVIADVEIGKIAVSELLP